MADIWQYLLPSLFGGGATSVLGAADSYVNSQNTSSIIGKVQNGQMSAEEALALIAQNGYKLSPEEESYLSSMLANQRTNEARDYETNMANTDLLRAASQLEQLGLGPSNVYQTGGSATPNVAAAATPMMNNANQRMNRYASIANSLIGMAGRMAASGIYGSSIRAVKAASGKAAAAVAHSAPAAIHSAYEMSEAEKDELLDFFK